MFWIFPATLPQIPNAILVEHGVHCHDQNLLHTSQTCQNSAYLPIKLPAFDTTRDAGSYKLNRFQFSVPLSIADPSAMALYLPGFADAIRVTFNGHTLLDMGALDQPPIQHWSRPSFVPVPQPLLSAENRIEIITNGYPQVGTGLHPFYFGSVQTLLPAYQKRLWFTKDLAQLGFAFMALSAVLFGLLYYARRESKSSGWLAMASLAAVIFSSHYALVQNPIGFHAWTIMWNMSLNAFVFALLQFVCHRVGVQLKALGTYYAVFLGVSFAIFALSPMEYVTLIASIFHVATIVMAIGVLTTLCVHRSKVTPEGFSIVFFLLSISLAVGMHDWFFFYQRPMFTNVQVGQIGVTLMMGVSIWLVLSELIASLKGFETLNKSLQAKTDEISASLTKSYEKLAVIEKQHVLDMERKRIMLDLHDGVGGQLVNILAYLQNQNVDDPVLEHALDSTLRDLSLMIDSLESHDSLTTSLGMLRARLEPLLEVTGLKFEWLVWEEPVIEHLGPTQILSVLRIAQEAITNAVKHAKAMKITVETTASSLIIRDDGKGMINPVSLKRKGANSGLGLDSMLSRAKSIGATLDVQTSISGTTVTLVLIPEISSTADKEQLFPNLD
ncbi:ATP-binding protein [Pseudosulfitobacter sp. SM2401]|uniref:sensor histidine kinase n=1 Tax=Pseudosulfitobacter sp. SM2401 TaxID=3350098 RepID=UPI0036F3BC8C